MRDPRVVPLSVLLAFLLLAIAAGFALLRNSGRAAPAPAAERWRAECASCHEDAGELVPVFRSSGGRERLIDVVLRGTGGHPTFERLTDEALAALLDHAASGGGHSPSPDPPYRPAEIRVRRAPRRGRQRRITLIANR
jgi:hypothetical protein